MVWRGVIEAYRHLLPLPPGCPAVTLLEGNTPLIPLRAVSRRLGGGVEVFGKYEGMNPTASFKDRGMTVAISKALHDGAKATICASTGNTAASAAAYSARAGMVAAVVVEEKGVALGKLAQAISHGAKVIGIRGNFDLALKVVREIADRYQVALVNSLNPYRLEGQKTAAFEICDVLGDAPEFHALPVGNAGNITAYWMGYREYRQVGRASRLPRMLGFQAEGAAPLVLGHAVEDPQTIATAIKIGNPASGARALAARDESGGLITTVSDEEIVAAYRLLGWEEGLFVEPASAASIAGVLKLGEQGYFEEARRARVVCTLTGHGLKDPDIAITLAAPHEVVEARAEVVAEAIGVA